MQGAGANASCMRASFCVVTQPTRVLQCAKWLHAPDPCCTCRPVGVLGMGGGGGVCVSFVGMCVSVCMRGLGASQHVCARPGVCVCVSPTPRPAPSVRVNCHVDFVLSFRITISDP